MKKLRLFFIVIFLILIGSSFHQINAQEKTKEEQEKEQKIQQEIDQQKKVMAEQKKALEEVNKSLKEQQSELDKVNKVVRVEVEKGDKDGGTVRILQPRRDRTESYYEHSNGDSERTTWEFSKSVRENTFSRDYTFDVEQSVNSVVMSVMGDCKAGEIRIKIVMPNGKSYSDIVIDELGNLNWRKSFTISETENQDKAGEWKFQIASTKATGFFKISLQIY